MDEPDGERVVELLDALDPTEALFYSAEDHVVDPFGKSTVLFKEIENYYGFVGGSQDQYVRYFHRTDLPSDYFVWRREAEVKAVSGFSTVPKKDATRQRKLLISCATNYWWVDVRRRAEHGLLGAAAFSTLHSPGDSWEV